MDCDGGCPEHTCLSCCNDRRVQLEQQVEALTEAIQNWYDNGYDRREAERLLATAQQGGEE